jgi:hypothetical protein
MPKMIAAAVLAGMLALSAAPARSAETPTANDTARFLAGLAPAPDSPLAALAKSPAWEQHARYLDSIFGREEQASLSKVRAFAQERLPEKHPTMLYMFSGPDFLYATSFFPSATTYVLSGLEPVGDVPPLTGLTRSTVDGSLHSVERSMGSLLSYSFFITRNMKTQLREGPVFGTLPILYVFLARTGKTIHDVSFVSLNADGSVDQPAAPGDKDAARRAVQSAAKGVKIVFSAGDGPQQTLYYFSTNIADDSVKRSGFLAFCAKLGVADSFIKSASYLLHSGGFTAVRNFILDHSATVLQDDSGIPLVYFDRKQWRLQPFGHYLSPLSIFPRAYQPEMAELFGRGNATPLEFGIGYRWRKNESNLLLALRTTPATNEAGTNPALTTGSDTSTGPDAAGTAAELPKPHRKRAETRRAPVRSGVFWGVRGLFGYH